MKFIKYFIILTTTTFITLAQPYKKKITAEIKGKVIDNKTKKPIPFATIYLYKKDSLINGSLTDKDGWFIIKNVPIGKVKIKIDFIGYKHYEQEILITPNNTNIILGDIKLSPKDIKLKEVEITGEKEIIETKIDKIVYNADKDITTEGGDATDILRKVPYVSVDQDGNVSIRGNSNVRIFINGKPSLIFSNNPGDALQALPADQIQKIEVITVPSAKYEGEGSAGIINIILKENKIKGKAGSFSVGGGNIYGSANANLGIKTDKSAIQLHIGGRYRYRGDGYTHFYMKQDSTELFQYGQFFPKRGGGHASISIQHQVKPNQTLQTELSLHTFNFIRENNMTIWGTNIPSYYRYAYTPKTFISSNLNVNYTIEYKKSKLFLLSSIQRSYNYESYSLTQTAPIPELNVNTKNENFAKSNRLDFQVDYEKNISESYKLETGTKLIRRFFNSEFSNIFNNNGTIFNNFNFFQDIYAGYFQITGNNKKFSFTSGIRYEHTANKFNSDTTSGKQSYNNWFPNITLGYSIKKRLMLKLSYTNRIKRPFIRRLNPFINAADPRSLTTGNPNLLPEITHIIELGLPPFITFFGNYTKNMISNYTIPVDSNTILTYPINAGESYSYGISLFIVGKFFKKKLSVFASSDIYYRTIKFQKYENSALQYRAMLNLQYLVKERFSIESMAFLNAPSITIQGTRPAFNMIIFGARYFINKNKTFSVALTITNPHLRYYEFIYTVETPELYQKQINGVYFHQIGINIKYRFGNFKVKEKRSGIDTSQEVF